MAGFNDVVGHESIIEHLKNAIQNNKISHAYILNGEALAGKKTIAKAFAMTLQCEKHEETPCGECHSCKQAMTNNHPDIIWVQHEKPSTISVDDIRAQVVNDIVIKPYSGKYKIYIIDECEKMNVSAQNALLKTIEEPPEYVVIMLLTNNTDLFLPTIISRCVTLNLRPISKDLIMKYLLEITKVPDYRAQIAVTYSGGNLGKAVKMVTSEHFAEMKDDVLQVVKHIKDMNLQDVIDSVKRVSIYKLEIDDYIDLMVTWYRDVLMYKATKDNKELIFKDEVLTISEQAKKMSYNGLENVIESLEKAKIRLKANVNFDLAIQLVYMTIMEEL